MKLVKSSDDKYLLHIWRTGTSFEYTGRYTLYENWNNIKFTSLPYPDQSPNIVNRNVRKPLPFDDNTFHGIYCNHVIEHLTIDEGMILAKELYRVLKKNGVCRMVTPNLELAASQYLESLEQVCDEPTKSNTRRYEWATTALIDQMVRKEPGGIMGRKLGQNDVDWDQVKRTHGDVFDNIRFRNENGIPHSVSTTEKLKKYLPQAPGDIVESTRRILYLLMRKFYITFSKRSYVELTDERNLWMYDRFSLSELLKNTGFENVKVLDFKTSQIEFWKKYDFDRSEKGDYPLEPSVYVEGIKH